MAVLHDPKIEPGDGEVRMPRPPKRNRMDAGLTVALIVVGARLLLGKVTGFRGVGPLFERLPNPSDRQSRAASRPQGRGTIHERKEVAMRSSVGARVARELQTVLERERDRLVESIRVLDEAERALGAAQGEESAAGGALADVASNAAEQELDLALGQIERARLAEVEARLQRLASGMFGACERCARPIEPARLLAVPWWCLCLSCSMKGRD
jgi:RNA polymerase-binding transcription factor DksA